MTPETQRKPAVPPARKTHRKHWYFIVDGEPFKTPDPVKRDSLRAMGARELADDKAYKAIRYAPDRRSGMLINPTTGKPDMLMNANLHSLS